MQAAYTTNTQSRIDHDGRGEEARYPIVVSPTERWAGGYYVGVRGREVVLMLFPPSDGSGLSADGENELGKKGPGRASRYRSGQSPGSIHHQWRRVRKVSSRVFPLLLHPYRGLQIEGCN